MIRTMENSMKAMIFTYKFSMIAGSAMEECQKTAMASMIPPSTPSWITSVRTATTFTRSQMFISSAGKKEFIIIILIQNLIIFILRAECFSSNYFQQCLQALLLEEERFLNMVQIIGRK